MYLKYRTIFLLFIFLFLFNVNSYAQFETDQHISILKKELFTERSEKILLVKYLKNKKGCINQKIDTTKYIRFFQPNYEIVINSLEKLMYANDPKLEDELKRIYEQHLDNFMKEWGDAYTNNWYACDEIKGQHLILTSFEQLLKKIYLEEHFPSDSLKISFYIKESIVPYKIVKDYKSGKEIMDREYLDVSDKYRSLNPGFPLRGSLKFTYFDAFREKLYPLVVDYILSTDYRTDEFNHPSDSAVVAFHEFDKIINNENSKIESFIYREYDSWRKVYRHVNFFKYATANYSEELSSFLIDKWLADNKVSSKNKELFRIRIRDIFFQDKQNQLLVFDKLLDLAKKDFPTALEFFKIMPHDDFTLFLNEKSDKDLLVKKIKKSISAYSIN